MNLNLKNGQKSKRNAIFKCSGCGNLHALLVGEVASECEICREKEHSQQWVETRKELLITTKNVRKEVDRRKTRADRISDGITDFCGNVYFVYIHIAWFALWIVFNSLNSEPFDPYPFGMLTLVVSLEAIILATFILMSQNRQGEVSELRSELDYQTDLKSEKNTAEILALVKKIYQRSRNE